MDNFTYQELMNIGNNINRLHTRICASDCSEYQASPEIENLVNKAKQAIFAAQRLIENDSYGK